MWSSSSFAAQKVEKYIRGVVAKAISDRCSSHFAPDFIRVGIFSCRRASNEVSYRSTIIGTETHNTTELLFTQSTAALLAQWTAPELESLSISFYTVYYKTFSEEHNQTAVALHPVPNDTTSFLLDVRDLTPGLQHQFRVTASVDIEGEVIEGDASEHAIVFGKLVSYFVG